MDLTDINHDPYQTTIRKMCMTEIIIGNEPGIQAIEQIDIEDRYHFVCKNEHEGQVRRLLDKYFDRLSDFFETTKSLHEFTGCDDYSSQSGRMQLSHGIDNYIHSLNLPSEGDEVFKSIVKEPHVEPPLKQRQLHLVNGKAATLTRGSDWNKPHFPSNTSTNSTTAPSRKKF